MHLGMGSYFVKILVTKILSIFLGTLYFYKIIGLPG